MRISYNVKAMMVELAGACFSYWSSFHGFLDSSGISKSLYGRYPKGSFSKYDVMRNILDVLEDRDDTEKINAVVSNFYRLANAVDRDQLDNERAKRLLQEFREAVGNDPIEAGIRRKERERARESYRDSVENRRAKDQRLSELNRRFLELTTADSYTAQQRGFEFERLFFDLLQFAEFEYTAPYRTPDGEQIDGHFRYEKFDYLVEVKWTSGPTKQKDLSIFDGKILGKAQSTRGFFLAANGFDNDAVNKDLAVVLDGRLPFFDVMKAKIDAIVRYGNINLSVRGGS